MRFINSSFTDAGFNLAAEEYLLKQGTEDVFMLWQSAPSVIIGKLQRVETEVNRTMAEQNKIPVFRRFSGGGAVYHDLGNINLTFIETTRLARFETYLERTVEMLTAGRSCSERRRTIGYLCRRAKSLGAVRNAYIAIVQCIIAHCCMIQIWRC